MAKACKPLEPGDGIHIVAPSGALEDNQAFKDGIARIRQAGFTPHFSKGLFSRHRYLAGSDQRRKEELLAALEDAGSRAIWIARGGFGATRLLPGINEHVIRTAGKWLIGFSDATALHCKWQNAGWSSLHAANISNLGTWSQQAQEQIFACLTGSRAPLLEGKAQMGRQAVCGKLLGGNLAVLTSLVGTGFLPMFCGCIVLLEEIGEKPYRIDRALTQLVHAGSFEGVLGFAIGQLTRCGDNGDSDAALSAILDVLEPLGVPILSNLPVGHEPWAQVVHLGMEVVLDPLGKFLDYTSRAQDSCY